ncbi:hypothetical protein [Kitasatospora sp. A2-31]|uniref:hypothetical protein n=1 Tax=Kitasatospora sp. A2-31 TaxID=2916414 RepID=UPI001EEDB8DD|nr:hypothetical protein [Kitasatospora sp. A2-31]MCG6499529.1 hypothetical protein [Kitasatospora sp. A2-31]
MDGARVGAVRQGEVAHFPVPAGTHTVQVTAKDRTRSNSVTVDVADGGQAVVTSRGTGLGVALVLPLLAGIAVPPLFVVAAILLVGAVLYALPGVLFRVRAEAPAPRPVPTPPATATPGGAAEHGGNGLWWESDPALAKRFAKKGA